MDTGIAEAVDTPEVLEAEVITEVAPEEVVEEATEETIEEVTEETADELADEAEDVAEEVTEEVAEPVTFDVELATTELIEQGKPILDKYELPQDVQAYVEALEQKAQVQPLAEFADYGDAEAVKTLLERQSHISTAREENGQARPNTDKFIESLDPDRKAWLAWDINHSPSSKYKGYTQFEEILVDTLAVEGDTVQGVLDRYQDFVEAFKSNAKPESDVPDFIPQNVREAYWQLDREVRDEIKNLDDEYDTSRIRAEVARLELMQKGIDSEKIAAQQQAQTAEQAKSAFEAEVVETQATFFKAFRDTCTADLAKNVKFAEDAKMNSLLAKQQIALMSQAFDEGEAGEFARAALAEAGIPFDHTRAQGLLKELELAAVNRTMHSRAKGADGQPLNPVELNKAVKDFQNVGRKWTQFYQDTLNQISKFVSTGKVEEVKKAVEKVKIPAKARTEPKGQATPAKKRELVNPHPYRSAEYYEWWAEQQMKEEAARGNRAYA